MAKAKRFTISGRVPSRYKGKTMTIEIRKPGRTYWDKVGTATISKTGRWSYRYTPKLGGKFYIRARYVHLGEALPHRDAHRPAWAGNQDGHPARLDDVDAGLRSRSSGSARRSSPTAPSTR